MSLVVFLEDSLPYSTPMTNKPVASSDSLALLSIYLITTCYQIRDGRRSAYPIERLGQQNQSLG